jgi:hypothetical protein
MMTTKKVLYSLVMVMLCFYLQAQKDTSKLKKLASEFDLKNYKSDPKDRLILEPNYTSCVEYQEASSPIGNVLALVFTLCLISLLKIQILVLVTA